MRYARVAAISFVAALPVSGRQPQRLDYSLRGRVGKEDRGPRCLVRRFPSRVRTAAANPGAKRNQLSRFGRPSQTVDLVMPWR